MTTEAPDNHDHAGFPIPSEPGDRLGAPGTINGPALGRLIGAAYDSCRPCQDTALKEITGDALTIVRLVELAAVAVQARAGGIPKSMLTPTPEGRVSKPFADLAALGADAGDDHRTMYGLATMMSDAERHQAADDALDLLVGELDIGDADVAVLVTGDWADATAADDRELGAYITETTPPAPPPAGAAEFGSTGVERLWQILVPVAHELAAVKALGTTLDTATHWVAPSPTLTVWGFTHEAALNAARALRDAGVPMVPAVLSGEAGA